MSETPIGDKTLSDIRQLVKSSELVGKLNEQRAILAWLNENLDTAPKAALPTYRKLIEWIESR